MNVFLFHMMLFCWKVSFPAITAVVPDFTKTEKYEEAMSDEHPLILRNYQNIWLFDFLKIQDFFDISDQDGRHNF